MDLEVTSTSTAPLRKFFCWFYISDSTLKDFLNSKDRMFESVESVVSTTKKWGERLIRIILRDMNRFCSLSFSYIRFFWLNRWRRGERGVIVMYKIHQARTPPSPSGPSRGHRSEARAEPRCLTSGFWERYNLTRGICHECPSLD